MLVESVIFLATVVVAWYAYFRYRRKRIYELADKIPGPCAELPLIGHGHIFAFKSHHEILKFTFSLLDKQKNRDVMKLWLGPKLIVALLHPRDIELVLSSNIHLDKAPEYGVFQPWFGNGLLISSGETWKKHRKLIAPTFHLNVLKRFMEQFNIRGRAVVEKMAQEKGKQFDCHEYMSECTVETLVETVMGVKNEFQYQTCYNYAMDVMKMCDIFHIRHTKIWMRPEFIFRLTGMQSKQDSYLSNILNFTKRVFNKKKSDVATKKNSALTSEVEEVKEITSELENDEKFSFGKSALLKDDIDDDSIGEKKRLPFLESMLEAASMGQGMSHEEIENQVNTLMFEGHDTTAAGMSFFFSVMAARPDIQEKCLEELDRIFGGSDRDVTFQDTVEMKYIERCIMETLRMFPPVPVIARQLNQELKLASCDVTIPVGATVLIGIIGLHRRDDIYKDPEHFNPDNFLPENSINRHYYSFIPFSAGPRSCVGRKYAMLKLKLIIAHVMRKYRIVGKMPIEDFQLQADVILKRQEGFPINLEPRRINAV